MLYSCADEKASPHNGTCIVQIYTTDETKLSQGAEDWIQSSICQKGAMNNGPPNVGVGVGKNNS